MGADRDAAGPPPGQGELSRVVRGRRRLPAPGLAALAGAALLSCAGAGGAPRAAEDAGAAPAPGFQARLEEIAAALDGDLGIAVLDLTSGDTFSVNGDAVYVQASVIKVPILVELFRQAGEGRLSLDTRLPLSADRIVAGSGVLQHLTPGLRPTLGDLATLTVVASDNTATNMLMDLVGMEGVNRTMAGLGLTATRLQRAMMDTAAAGAGRENLSTPDEAARLMRLLYEGALLDRAACDEILRLLSIPKPGRIRALLPSGTRVAHKTGSLPGVVNDVGIVYLEGRPFVVAAMAGGLADEAAGETAIAEVGLAAYRHFERLAAE